MFIALGAFLFVAFMSLAFVSIAATRVNVRQLEAALDSRDWETSDERRLFSVPAPNEFKDLESIDAARFTSSLLCLSRVQSQVKSNSPEPVHDGVSSLVLVPLPQSRSLVRES